MTKASFENEATVTWKEFEDSGGDDGGTVRHSNCIIHERKYAGECVQEEEDQHEEAG